MRTCTFEAKCKHIQNRNSIKHGLNTLALKELVEGCHREQCSFTYNTYRIAQKYY